MLLSLIGYTKLDGDLYDAWGFIGPKRWGPYDLERMLEARLAVRGLSLMEEGEALDAMNWEEPLAYILFVSCS